MIFNPGMNVVNERYNIEGLLGRGGFGEVYKARDNQLDRVVALKVIQRNPAGSSGDTFFDYETRFKQEAVVGAKINNDHVIRVYDVAQHSADITALILEFAENGSLTTRIAQKLLSPSEAIEIATQICKGLAAIHLPPLNGVHRDIKPSNILFDSLNRAKVADLGLVQMYGFTAARSLGEGGKHPGTPMYMSPEQEQETGYLTPASDIYAMGCVLFEMLTQRVYQQLPRGARVSSIVPDVPPALEAVVEQALAVDPAQRFQDAEVMRQALERCRTEPVKEKEKAPVVEPGVFIFAGGVKVRTPDAWAEAADRNWADAASRLARGAVEQWLTEINRQDLTAQVAEIRKKQGDADIALEQVLHLFLPSLEQPRLRLDTELLDFGTLEHGARRTLKVSLANYGRGLLYGQVTAAVPWLRGPRSTFKCRGGQTISLDFGVDSASLGEGNIATDVAAEVQSNGGQAVLKAQANITWAPDLTLSATSFNFGEYLVGESPELRQQSLVLKNNGGGILEGTVDTEAEWLAVSPRSFRLANNQEETVQVSADPSRLEKMDTYQADIRVRAGDLTRTLTARIKHIAPEFKSDVRWRAWGLYLAAMVFAWIGLAFTTAFASTWLRSSRTPPEIWQLVLLAAWPLLGLVIVLLPARRTVPQLDTIEDFYHRASLEAEVVGRRADIVRQVLFGLIVPAVLAIALLRAGSVRSMIAPFTLTLLGACLLFGILLLAPHWAGRQFSALDRWLALPRVVLMGIVTLGLYALLVNPLVLAAYSFDPGTTLPTAAAVVAFGMLLYADYLTGLPMRLQWLWERVKPALPVFILLGLFFLLTRGLLYPGQADSLTGHYAEQVMLGYYSYGAGWWRDLLFLAGTFILLWVGLWFDTTRGANVRVASRAAIAAWLVGSLAGLLGLFVLRSLIRIFGWYGSGTSTLGWLGIGVTLTLAAAGLWMLRSRRAWLKQTGDRVAAGISRLAQKLPGAASRAADAMANVAQQSGLGDVANIRPSGQVTARLKVGADRAASVMARSDLKDYLNGQTAIPFSAALAALVTILFSAPTVYRFLAAIFGLLTRIGSLVLVLLILAALVAAVFMIMRNANRR